MTLDFKKFERILFNLLIFLLPTQLALHIWPSWSLVFGIRVDYLSPTIYFTDVLFFVLFIVYLINDRSDFYKILRKYRYIILLFVTFIFINTIFSTSTFPTIYRWIKIIEVSFFGVYVFLRKNLLKAWKINRTLFTSLVAFSLIGIFQVILGHTIGGVLYFLGERSFGTSTPGIALFTLFGQNFLRAYSTFSHPNSLAGYMSVGLLLLIPYIFKKRKNIRLFGFLIISTGIVLAFSLASLVALIGCLIIYLLYKNKFLLSKNVLFLPITAFALSLFLSVFSNKLLSYKVNFSQSVSQRLGLSSVSGKMISQKFLIGEGLNTFTIMETKFIGTGSFEWILQPVHNIYLLAFSETGIFGLVFLFILFYLCFNNVLLKNRPILLMVISFILITGLFDHYWLTLQQNILLFSFIVGSCI